MSMSVGKKFRDFDLQRGCQRSDDKQRRVPFPALHTPDIRPMMFRPGGKFLLAPATFLAESPQPLAKFPLHRLHTRMKPG